MSTSFYLSPSENAPHKTTDMFAGRETSVKSADSQTSCIQLPSDYTPFSLEWRDAYNALYAELPTHPLVCSLASLWAWAEWEGLEVRFTHNLAWLRARSGEPGHFAPVGAWKKVNWKELEPVLRGMGKIIVVPELLARMWEAQLSCPVRIIEDRDKWEYLYSTADMASLTGNRFHTQRNHINAFEREYGESNVRPLDMNNTAVILTVADIWLANKAPSPGANNERRSLERLLDAWDKLDLVGLGLYLPEDAGKKSGAQELAAFSIGYRLNNTTMGHLYAKAKPGLRGIFPLMVRAFARTVGQGYTLINQAEDVGDPGLRKSKLLYRPVEFQRIYTVYIGES